MIYNLFYNTLELKDEKFDPTFKLYNIIYNILYIFWKTLLAQEKSFTSVISCHLRTESVGLAFRIQERLLQESCPFSLKYII